jgi:radical SAM protein with 4Fe4S-binding SPASM domain
MLEKFPHPKFFSLPRKKKSPCRDLWRILVVLWNGKVVPCCVDFEGNIILGDAERENLQKIFKGPAMKALRKSHLQKRLSGLCEKCSPYSADYHLPSKVLRS